jgi:hypothetical protein
MVHRSPVPKTPVLLVRTSRTATARTPDVVMFDLNVAAP